MKDLTEKDILDLIREEWNLKLESMTDKISVYSKASGEKKNILSPELKVKHKTSGIRYTIDSVHPREVVLRTPEEKLFAVSDKDLEKNYEIA